MRNCEINGYGTYLPDNKISFGDQTRYRVTPDVDQLDMLGAASLEAMERAEVTSDEIDCIIVGSAVGVQPLPCTAALLQERIAPGAPTAAFDVNSSCSSFITALDVAADRIALGRSNRVLIAAGDVGTRALNPNQRESYELFSDAGVAVVVSATEDKSKGVLASAMRTWPQHAHDTELRGGLSANPPENYAANPEEYLFDMNGRRALLAMATELPPFFQEFWQDSGLTVDEIDLVIPHQASRALGMVMRKLGIPDGKYVDEVKDYGNMVSASVPYMFAKQLGEGALQTGDTTILCGTAAGLTANILAIRL